MAFYEYWLEGKSRAMKSTKQITRARNAKIESMKAIKAGI